GGAGLAVVLAGTRGALARPPGIVFRKREKTLLRRGVIFTCGSCRGRRREQLGEHRRERFNVAGIGRGGGDAVQAGGEAAFVFAVAAQVEQAVFEHQRGVGGRFFVGVARLRHPARTGQRAQPVAGRRPVGGRAGEQLRFARIERGVAGGDGKRGE